jgi:3-deoxy-D-arabino-heptulosonate 7-phosphate (DAHP) synthase class II
MATEVDLNRWREAGKEIGRKIGVVQERERIIKLLESFDPRTAIGDLLPLLIKGENK